MNLCLCLTTVVLLKLYCIAGIQATRRISMLLGHDVHEILPFNSLPLITVEEESF